MVPTRPDTEQLLLRVGRGDPVAEGLLLQRHRNRLRQMVAVRMDRRLAARLDPSDVIQDALAEAAGKLADYARSRPLPFYPWLRQIALEHVVRLHRRHVKAGRRSVAHEGRGLPLPDESAQDLADRLVCRSHSPSQRARTNEVRARIRSALLALADPDREVLVLRYLEHLSTGEIAAVLGLAESGVKSRQLRALRRLRDLLGDDLAEDL